MGILKKVAKRGLGLAKGAGKLAKGLGKKTLIGAGLSVGAGLAVKGVSKLFGKGKSKGGRKKKSIAWYKRATALIRAKKEYNKARGY